MAILGTLFACTHVMGRDTEEQLLRQLRSESNPVKKAKIEIKLANLKLDEVRDAYSEGHPEAGAKLLGTFLAEMKISWKLLQDSGREAWKHSDGFRELEISLRENGRALEDLARGVSYYERSPLTEAAQEMDRMHSEVIKALFPGRNPKGIPPPATNTSPTNPPAQK